MVADRIAASKRFKGGSTDLVDSRGAVAMPIITTYRTDADPRCTDLSLDANDRPYGSVISPKPALSNYGVNGFGRLTTPEAWLSTWSGISSNASLERSLQGVTVPATVVEYTRRLLGLPERHRRGARRARIRGRHPRAGALRPLRPAAGAGRRVRRRP